MKLFPLSHILKFPITYHYYNDDMYYKKTPLDKTTVSLK